MDRSSYKVCAMAHFHFTNEVFVFNLLKSQNPSKVIWEKLHWRATHLRLQHNRLFPSGECFYIFRFSLCCDNFHRQSALFLWSFVENVIHHPRFLIFPMTICFIHSNRLYQNSRILNWSDFECSPRDFLVRAINDIDCIHTQGQKQRW